MRWIIRIAAFIAIVVVLGLGALVAVPTERVADLVADRLSAATGRAVMMDGDLRPTLFPSLGVRVGDVSIGNPDWVEAGPLLTAERLDVSVAWAPLLRGEIRLDRAEFVAPQITLVRAADGRVSWDFADPDTGPRTPIDAEEGETGAANPDAPFLIGFDRAAISDGALRWIDETTGRRITVTDLDAVLSLPTGASRATVEASANVDGTELAVDVALDGVAPLLSGEVRPVAAALTWAGGAARFDGRVSLTPALDGAVTFEATDLEPLLALAGAAMPDLPPGAGRDRVAARGQITLTDAGSIHLRDGALSLDENEVILALDITRGEARPMIRGTVSGGVLTVGSVDAADPVGAGGGATEGSGWPSDPIDGSGLFAVDAEIALRFGGVQLSSAQLGAIEVNTTLTDGRMVAEIGRVEAYGGRLAGQFVVNGRGGLSVGGDLILSEVQLAPLLGQFAGFDRLEGTGNASLQFLGVGNDIATIMSSLQGQGDFAFGAGAILGFDLAGMIRNFDASFQGDGARTVYDSVTANFVIANGILENDDLLLDAPWGGVEGAGTVNLGAQTVDYRVIPGVMRDAEGQAGISVPILVSGPWSNLSVRPDLEFLAEQEFLEQRDRLAAEAEARLAEEQDRLEGQLRDRANEVLGTGIEAGDGQQEIEDALQDRLTEEAENILSRILGGGGSEVSE